MPVVAGRAYPDQAALAPVGEPTPGDRMAKKSQLARDKKRRDLYERHKAERELLRAKLRASWDDPQARWEAQVALQKLPRNSSPSRLKNRCEVTGRSRGYMRKFGLSRITFREMASQGLLPGIRKSSW